MGNRCCVETSRLDYASLRRPTQAGPKFNMEKMSSLQKEDLDIFLSQLPTQDSYENSMRNDIPSPLLAVPVSEANDLNYFNPSARMKLALYNYEQENNDEYKIGSPLLSPYKILSTNQIYKGQWHEGKRHGQGELYEPDGSVYKGYWKNDMKHGKGKYIWSDGKVYTGEWKDDQMCGQGEIVWPNGSKYVGEFKDGARDGSGEHEYANKSRFVGTFKNDKMDGEGLYHSPTGKTRSVLWKNGERIRWY